MGRRSGSTQRHCAGYLASVALASELALEAVSYVVLSPEEERS
jgi:hypothetical protein